MKTLFILRHGKSSWEHIGLSDFERPLLKNGIERTEKVGEFLVSNGIHIQRILSSPATRAKQTAEVIAQFLKTTIEIDNKLYPGDIDDLLSVIYSQPDHCNSLMLVAHNPGLTSLVNELMNPRYDWLSTSGLVVGKFDISQWNEINITRLVDLNIVAPKEF